MAYVAFCTKMFQSMCLQAFFKTTQVCEMDTKREKNWRNGADEQHKVTYMQKWLYHKWF